MEKILQKIVKEQRHCYFVSPHFDDAVLSAGSVISYLTPLTPVTVVNVFTQANNKRNTLSGVMALHRTGFRNQSDYYRERVKEDKMVMNKLGVKYINLGFEEALWRRIKKLGTYKKFIGYFIPEFISIYPTFKLHIIKGHISAHDISLIKLIQKKLSFIKKGDVVFCPIAIGGHIDHLIVREACKDISARVILWEDYPYSIKESSTEKNSYIIKTFPAKKSLRNKLIAMYKTQFPNFSIGRQDHLAQETFFITK